MCRCRHGGSNSRSTAIGHAKAGDPSIKETNGSFATVSEGSECISIVQLLQAAGSGCGAAQYSIQVVVQSVVIDAGRCREGFRQTCPLPQLLAIRTMWGIAIKVFLADKG